MPALFFFSLSQYGALVHIQTLALDGNALDIATDSLSGNLIVSIDTIHTPGSTTELRNNENAVQALQTFQFKESAWGTSNLTFDTPDADATQKEAYGTLSGVLYNLENLRKRGGEE
jgi:tRNA (guanine-N(7)-)-methyltransferase subunit TRM82